MQYNKRYIDIELLVQNYVRVKKRESRDWKYTVTS